VDAAGDLVLYAAGGEIRQQRPRIYQEVAGVRQTVAGGYVLTGEREVAFHVDHYDATRPLVIDPVIAYSTYLGGSGYEFSPDKDAGNDIALNQTAKDWHTRVVTLSEVKGLKDRFFATLLMTYLSFFNA
jgi:hypothetical protein